MRRKKKQNSNSKVWTWISIVIFGLLIALLLTSLIKRESPVEIVKGLFKKELKEGDLMAMDKEELVKIINRQQAQIDTLDERLDRYIRHFGVKSAMIEVQGETLNLRSEPSINSEILEKIPNNTIIGIIKCLEEEVYLDGANGHWCEIKFAGIQGWVWGNYLKEIDF